MQHIRCFPRPWALVPLLLIIGALAVAEVLPVRIARDVVGGGGGTLARGNTVLTYTIGQSLAGSSTPGGGGLELRSGFWQPAGGVSAAPEEEIPAQPILYRNAPNPFNPRTEILFSVGPEARWARVRVFDVQGRQVRTLVDGLVAPGIRKVIWQGRDDMGGQMASGLYFCRLEVAGNIFTQKMLLLK